MIRFLHTADWQIGKSFAAFETEVRAKLDAARLRAIHRIAELAREHSAAFVLVAGDLFDSPRPERRLVNAALSAIGKIPVPVFVIPGNHDHAAPDSVWFAAWFESDRAQLAPHLHVLLEPEPAAAPGATLLACPLRRRSEPTDPTAWTRNLELEARSSNLPRIVLAHGSVRSFGAWDSGAPVLELERIPHADYIALGDWHGTFQALPHAWYSGTPEPDRFPKADTYSSGNTLLVTLRTGSAPHVQVLQTGSIRWSEVQTTVDSSDLPRSLLEHPALPPPSRVHADVLHLRLDGTVSLAARRSLEGALATLRARVLHLELDDQTVAEPSAEELEALTRRSEDPLLARVAANLLASIKAGGPDSSTARAALVLLHAELAR